MYYPIQIPYVLDETFLNYLNYHEEKIPECAAFIICYWEMTPRYVGEKRLNNIIITDGCIDLIVDFKKQKIGFSGMRETDFSFSIVLPNQFMGLRLMPGAFRMLTGRSPEEVLDKFLPVEAIYPDFPVTDFFSLPFVQAKKLLLTFIKKQLEDLQPSPELTLFNRFNEDPPQNVGELCRQLAISQSQCQREFKKYYGLTPKMVLSILRFQKALRILTSQEAGADAALAATEYYDQSHFINDFKRNIGITPSALLAKYQID